jgi:hypothetical protein
VSLGSTVGAGLAFLALVGASSSARPVSIVHGGGSDEGPVAENGWFAWMNSPTANVIPPISHTVVYVRYRNGPKWRANPPGTFAETGGISGHTLVIQLLDQGSELASVDLRTRALRLLPAPFNEQHRFEWRPSLWGPWLLYGSIDYAAQRYSIVLANLRTRSVRTLDEAHGHAAYAAPGQVNGNFATWITCPDNHCRAYRYDIATRTTVIMPPIGGARYGDFGPSVAADGTLYFGLATGCANVRLVRWRNGTVTTIYRFPPGTGFNYSYVTDTRPRTIYYDEVGCNIHALSNIDAIRDPGA